MDEACKTALKMKPASVVLIYFIEKIQNFAEVETPKGEPFMGNFSSSE